MNSMEFKGLLKEWADVMMENKDYLIELDGVVGDSDLGLTMSDGFKAAYETAKDNDETDIGKLFYTSGKAMSQAVPSTMGTLMASGLMQIGKAMKGKTEADNNAICNMFTAYVEGVQNRGKAKVGDKTFLDGFVPGLDALKESVEAGEELKIASGKAYEAAKAGFQNTTTMVAVHGRAATRGEKSRELLDPGAAVAMLLYKGFMQFCA